MTGVPAISESTSHSGGLNYLHADGEQLWGPVLVSCMHIAVEADAGSVDLGFGVEGAWRDSGS